MDSKTLIFPILAIVLFITQTATGTKESYTNFIKTKCNVTLEPTLCVKTLMPYACTIKNNPRILCIEALKVAIKGTRSAGVLVYNLEKKEGISKYEAVAFRDCVEAVKSAEDELRKTVKIIGHLNGAEDKESQLHDAISYTSTVLTNVQTCIYGFDELEEKANPNVDTGISRSMGVIMDLSSNALSLITHL